ncbi:MAG: LytTR family DNA-binding domain-containing protein [Bacteroidales bacterium]|nr:LytTR family DNA-binding domain-containing protein [Bacteroidales bacterium]
MLKAIIADDEKDANDLLESALKLCCPNVQIVAKCYSVGELEQKIQQSDFDFLLLDIQMPGGDVFEMLNRLSPVNFEIIFITAHNQYALQAIKRNAADYLLKPLDIDELKNAVSKVQSRIAVNNAQKYDVAKLVNKITSQQRKIEIVNNDRIFYLKLSDIIRFEADGNYVRIITISGENYFVAKKLKEYHLMLENYDFFRVHHSYLININYVKSVFTKDLMIVMVDNKVIPLSRKRKEEFLQLMSTL